MADTTAPGGRKRRRVASASPCSSEQFCKSPAAILTTTDSSGALHVLHPVISAPSVSPPPTSSPSPHRPTTSASSEASEAPPSSSRNPTPTPSSSSRGRFTWTPELHARFLQAVYHLGLDNAMPKSILALMHVPGMTREHVASHLQKYRQQLKKQGQLAPPPLPPIPPTSNPSSTPITTKELCYPVEIPLSLVLNPLSFANYGPLCNPHGTLAHHPSLVLPPSLPANLVARDGGGGGRGGGCSRSPPPGPAPEDLSE